MTNPYTARLWARRDPWLFLLPILAVAAWARLWGINFGMPHVRARPDELIVSGFAIGFYAGDLNPRFFDYPTFYLYLLAGLYFTYYVWGLLGGHFQSIPTFMASWRRNWVPFFLMGRYLSALLGTLTVVVVHRIAFRLFDRTTALVAALFMALAFLHVRDSHYSTADAPLTFLMMCSMWFVLRAYLDRERRDFMLAGVFGGLAMATKYNAALLIVPMIVGEALHILDARSDRARALRESPLPRMAILFGLVFIAASPYVLLDYGEFLYDIRNLQTSLQLGMTPPEMLGRGWTYHLVVSLRFGLGLPLLASGLAGMLLLAHRDPRLAAVFCSFPIAYYIVAGAGYTVFVRYMIPVIPFLCITAALFVMTAADWLARLVPIPRPAVATLFALLTIAPSAYSVVRFDRLLGFPDSRLVAAEWVQQNVPAGSSIYQAGAIYGHLQLGPVPEYQFWSFDYRSERFYVNRQPTDKLPQWIVVQESAVPYTHVAPAVANLLRRQYDLVFNVRAADPSDPRNVYDLQDAFFVPIAGFKARRPGPNLYIYRHRGAG